MKKGKHEPVELTPRTARIAKKMNQAKSTGSGQARRAGNAVIRRDNASSSARAAADKALGITRR